MAYIVRKPGNGRKSFSVLKRDSAGKSKQIKNDEIDSINKAYLAKLINVESADVQVREVVKKLYDSDTAKFKISHCEANKVLFDQFWAAEYQHRDLVDVQSAINDFKRALDAVGTLSLISSKREELQAKVAKVGKGNKQRRIVERLNTLLKFCRRDFKLRKDRPVRHVVNFITLTQLRLICAKIVDVEQKLLVETAFFTGCRAGELFALTSVSVKGNRLAVNGQMDRALDSRDTKTRRGRNADIIVVGLRSVKKWCAVSDKEKLRGLKLSAIVGHACRAAGVPVITFHDLRHSYAVHCFTKGVSLGRVAISLGNSQAVCERHYLPYLPVDDGANVAKLLASE